MISRRTGSVRGIQNTAHQSSFTPSRGIDITKNPLDPNSLAYAENLDIAPDGSAELRKPIVASETYDSADSYSVVRVFYLYDKRTKLVIVKFDTGKYGMYFVEHDVLKNYCLETVTTVGELAQYWAPGVTDDVTSLESYSGVPSASAVAHAPVSIPWLNLSDATCINNVTSTVLGGCKFDLTDEPFNTIGYTGDVNCYMWDSYTTAYVAAINAPRYLQIRYVKSNECWVVRIVNPVMNNITGSEASVNISKDAVFNTCLDNPYAIRDVYSAGAISIDGIVPYAPTQVVGDNVKVRIPPASQGSNVTKESDVSQQTVGILNASQPDSWVKYRTNTFNYTDADSNITFNLVFNVGREDPNTSGEEYAQLTDFSISDESYVSFGAGTVSAISFTVIVIHGNGDIIYGFEKTYTFNTISASATNLNLTEFHDAWLDNPASGYCWLPLDFEVDLSFTVTYASSAGTPKVKQLTERITDEYTSGYSPVVSFPKNINAAGSAPVYLKAFMKFVDPANVEYFGIWEYTLDGAVWLPCAPYDASQTGTIKVGRPTGKFTTVDGASTEIMDAIYVRRIGLNSKLTASDAILNDSGTVVRPDVLVIPSASTSRITSATYRFTVYSLDTPLSVINAAVASGSAYLPQIRATLAQCTYTTVTSTDYEFLSEPNPVNTVNGKKLLWKSKIYSYGDSEFKNVIYASNAGEFTTPMLNAIDLAASEDTLVTSLIPWRDYLIAGTPNALYLIQSVDGGYLSKAINTAIGVPEKDSKTCRAILNGIVFKSGTKIYSLQPSIYSGDDSILNMSELSKPIDGYIPETYGNYECMAFTTERAYYLFIPTSETTTTCLKYTYSTRIWVIHKYPVRFEYYEMLNVDDIRIFGKVDDVLTEFCFEKDFADIADAANIVPYGDALRLVTSAELDLAATGADNYPAGYPYRIVQFSWCLDSGQKTDNISITKQFITSKLIFATLADRDHVPLTLQVYIDGNLHKYTYDYVTDGTFVKTGIQDILTLGSNIQLNEETDFKKALRQIFVRYTGKGKSIRHVISGTSCCAFKLYEVYYRYRNLNITQ